MSERLLSEAVAKMLLAFAGRVDEDKAIVFMEAVEDKGLCATCAAAAARSLSASNKRMPVPADLIEETRYMVRNGEHDRHISDHPALRQGDTDAWWASHAPGHIKRHWPELSGEQALMIARAMRDQGFVQPDSDGIALELGYADKSGPTLERQWWLSNYPDLPRPDNYVDPRLPVADR